MWRNRYRGSALRAAPKGQAFLVSIDHRFEVFRHLYAGDAGSAKAARAG